MTSVQNFRVSVCVLVHKCLSFIFLFIFRVPHHKGYYQSKLRDHLGIKNFRQIKGSGSTRKAISSESNIASVNISIKKVILEKKKFVSKLEYDDGRTLW